MKFFFWIAIIFTWTQQTQLMNNTIYSVIQSNDRGFQIIAGKQKYSLGYGQYNDLTQIVGWGKLSLFSNQYNLLSAKALGFLEGALTSHQVYQQLQNALSRIVKRTQSYENYLLEQYHWTWKQIQNNQDEKYWKEMEKLMVFLEGLLDGINQFAAQGEHLSLVDLLYIQAGGDSIELFQIFNVTYVNEPQTSALQFLLNNHCSVLIKQVQSEVYMGHTTWTHYNQLLRVFKFYKFGDQIDISFSGYFGVIYSKDDYYTLNKKKIYVTETTNSVFNKSLLSLITHESALTWQRTMIANYLANSGEEWTKIFAKYNSGTYNNQFMILDASRFDQQKQKALSGFLWIIEQMPGQTESQDVTDYFNNENGTWVSYNIPYFKKIYNYAGYDNEYQIHGDQYSYSECPRAKIFRRDQHNVIDLNSYKYMMRYNKYQTDPFSLGNAANQISARSDLNTGEDFALFGGIDCKVTTLNRLQNGIYSDIQSGPTYYDQEPFTWDKYQNAKGNLGQARTFKFDWVQFQNDF